MLFNIANVALALTLATRCAGQDRFVSEIPESETVALSQIVEDDPANDPQARKGGDQSPEYKPLYQKALPIPPVAVPKQ